MKKIIALFVSLLLIVCFSSCANIKKDLEFSQDRANVQSIEIYKYNTRVASATCEGASKKCFTFTVIYDILKSKKVERRWRYEKIAYWNFSNKFVIYYLRLQ